MNEKRIFKRHHQRAKRKKKELTKKRLREEVCDNCIFFIYSRYHSGCSNRIRKTRELPKERTCNLWIKEEDGGVKWWDSFP